MTHPHYLFVTGRLAEEPLRETLEALAPQAGFDYSVAVMPITIAALITPRWLARRIEVPEEVTRIVVPGYCQGDLGVVEEAARVPVDRGPRDLRELPAHFGGKPAGTSYGVWDIEIFAKVRGASQRSVEEILDLAVDLADEGADAVLLEGAGRPWPELGRIVEELRRESQQVAVANVCAVDLLAAVPLGIELVVPGDREQWKVSVGLGCETVVNDRIAGSPSELTDVANGALRQGVSIRIDPGLKQIGTGLAASLGGFLDVRRRWPDAEMMMSFAEVTESAQIDSAAVHLLLMGICQELGIKSVVVSQEVNWCRSAVRECHLARQLARSAVQCGAMARDAEPGLLMLRDVSALEFGGEELERLAEILRDPSPRIFAEDSTLHAVSAGQHLESADPFDLFERIRSGRDRELDASQAFYLGYEMAKAMTALTLGKTYRQDEALDWGILTRRELTRMERRALRMSRHRDEDCKDAAEYFAEDPVEDAYSESDE